MSLNKYNIVNNSNEQSFNLNNSVDKSFSTLMEVDDQHINENEFSLNLNQNALKNVENFYTSPPSTSAGIYKV